MFARRVDGEVAIALLEEQHAPALFALIEANRAYLRRWLPWLDQNTAVDHTLAFIRASLAQFAARDGLACAILFRGAIAGVVGLHRIDWPNRRTSVGYWVAEGLQGRGLVTRSVGAVLDYVFGELGLNHVEIACAPGTRRSGAVPRRLGFRREARLRQREWLYDRFVDHHVYGITAAEWTVSTASTRRSGRGRRPSARG